MRQNDNEFIIATGFIDTVYKFVSSLTDSS